MDTLDLVEMTRVALELQAERERLRVLMRDAQRLMQMYHATVESLYGKPRTLRAPVLAEIEAWQSHAQDVLGRSE